MLESSGVLDSTGGSGIFQIILTLLHLQGGEGSSERQCCQCASFLGGLVCLLLSALFLLILHCSSDEYMSDEGELVQFKSG